MATLEDFLAAVMGQESGGNYRAVNSHTGALGLYQVLPSNVAPWARQYLGRSVTPSQFLNSRSLQTQLVTAVMGSYVRRYGYRGAAAAWYSGNPALANNYNPQRYGPSIGDYVDEVMQRFGSGGFTGALSGIADSVKGIGTQIIRSQPGYQQDPLEAQQATMGDINPAAKDRNEPSAVKGLGLTMSDGAGMGQIGLEAPKGWGGPGSMDGLVSPSLDMASRSHSRDAFTMTGAGIGGEGGGYRNPVPGFKVTFGFGEAYATGGHAAGSRHHGLDFAAPMGTRIYAPMSGKIVSAGWERSGFGNAIRIQHPDGTYSILGHLSSVANLRPGQVIRAGTFLGNVGSTGDSSGAHLHWEMRRSLYDPDTAFDFSDLIEW